VLHKKNKSLKAKNIAIRVDGHKGTGMGHISRMIVLARYLRETENVEIFFITKNSQPATEIIISNGFESYTLDFNISIKEELDKVNKIIHHEEPHVIIIDVLGCSSDSEYINCVKKISDLVVISFTDIHNKMCMLAADVVINSSILQMGNESFYKENYYLGLDYCLLSSDYMNLPQVNQTSNTTKKVMVCMGGVDHNNLTLRVLNALDRSINNFEFSVILSASYTDKEKMEAIKKSMNHKMKIHYDVDGIYAKLNTVDFAITAGGNAHAERISAGVPGIAISQESHQDASVVEYEKFGATLNLGIYSELNEDTLLKSFDKLYENTALQDNMVNIGRKLLDGHGLQRVSNIIMQKK
jgi:UDP-2,4-diacetamido-2,4,6-trideoxy-beta-L-altropyranose hydrolase